MSIYSILHLQRPAKLGILMEQSKNIVEIDNTSVSDFLIHP